MPTPQRVDCQQRRAAAGSRWSTATGILLILAAALVPSMAWIHMLRQVPDALRQQLLEGAALFRLGLAALGLAALGLPRMPFWKAGRKRPASQPAPGYAPWVVAALLAAAFAMRLYQLNAGLWLDEIYTFSTYFKMPFGEIVTTYVSENQHFLYSLMAHASYLAFGLSAWALRLPAVVFGVAGIWALYLLGRQVAGTREGLLSAALLVFSYQHIWFSQNARGYTGLLFWTLLASWFFVRALRETEPRLWLGYAVCAALGVYTHTTMIFVIAGHVLSYAIQLLERRREHWPDRWAGLFAGFGMAGLFTFQLHALVFPQIFSGIEKTRSVVDAWKRPLWTLLEVVQGLKVSFAGGAVALCAVLIFAAGIWSYFRKERLIIECLFFPPLVGASVVMVIGHHLWPRFFFFAFGFAVLVTVRGAMTAGELAMRLARLTNWRPAFVGTALCVGMLGVSAASFPFAYGPKQDYGGALDFVKAQREPGDAVVTVGLASFPFKSLYQVPWQDVRSVDDLNAVRSRAQRTWLLYTLRPVLQSVAPEIMASIERDFRVVRKFPGTLHDGTVFVCRSDQPVALRAMEAGVQ
jgi:4-amino-4-deoxy-L-arabinose transferase-like glycosyltransferase